MIRVNVWSEKELRLCRKESDNSGWDIQCAEDVKLKPSEIRLVHTGIHVDLSSIKLPNPFGVEIQVRPRSGLGSLGISIVNTPGTIDKNYTGSIDILLINFDQQHPQFFERGTRIAQLVFAPIVKIDEIIYVDRFQFDSNTKDSERGSNGFGSSGIKDEDPLVIPQRRFYRKDPDKNREYIEEKPSKKSEEI